jgi:glycosyltransferase involved in cell wall biosynthesis
MKIILNFIPLKSGGGVQVGLDFIAQAILHGKQHEWHVVATEGTPPANVNGASNLKLAKTVQASMLHRLWFEYVGCRKLVRKIGADLIYTQFGPHWPGAKLINIVGCAYSNLFYPEINFWERFPLSRRLVRKGIDLLRMLRLRQADHVIFETEDLARRAVRLKGFQCERVSWVKPSVSSLVAPDKEHIPTRELCRRLPKGFRVLLLSTYNPNKNIDLLPRIAKVIDERFPDNDMVFVMTLPPQSSSTLEILKDAQKLGVSDRIVNLGPIPQEGCAEVYRACNLVILPSQLESFSNTIAEAWAMRKPLLISDMDWSRSLCNAGAAYFRYRDSHDAAEQIHRIRNDSCYYTALVAEGESMLRTYPTACERFRQYLSIIERFSRN